ncbi:MAG TPA: TIGR02206 family membrane protein [Spirochaetota bacterium]|nr:TIGR02206 family membrane protein [Spirochaetota bacterium]
MNIFNSEFSGRFSLFTTAHLVTITLIFLLWITIPLLLKKYGTSKSDRIFRCSLAILLLVQYLSWMMWEVLTGHFTVGHSLPLNLCDLSVFLCAFMLFRKSYAMFEILYFWALAGTVQSFITPNIYFGWPHLEFIVFYIQHGGEILTILYLVIVSGFYPRPVSILKSLAVFFPYVIVVYIFNLFTDSNYMFLMADTPHPSTVTRMINIFGNPPRHLAGLGLVAILSHLLLYIPFLFIRKKN